MEISFCEICDNYVATLFCEVCNEEECENCIEYCGILV